MPCPVNVATQIVQSMLEYGAFSWAKMAVIMTKTIFLVGDAGLLMFEAAIFASGNLSVAYALIHAALLLMLPPIDGTIPRVREAEVRCDGEKTDSESAGKQPGCPRLFHKLTPFFSAPLRRERYVQQLTNKGGKSSRSRFCETGFRRMRPPHPARSGMIGRCLRLVGQRIA